LNIRSLLQRPRKGKAEESETIRKRNFGQLVPLFLSVFLMRFAFSFTVISLQYIVASSISLGVISAAYPIMEMVTGIFLGVLADKAGRKWLIVFGLLFSSSISISFTFSSNSAFLAIIHGLQGICACAIIVGSLALVTDLSKQTSRGLAMGVYDFSTIIGYASGFFFALVLINGNPANAYLPFYLGGVMALIGGIISAAILKDVKVALPKLDSLRENIRRVSKSPTAQSLLPAWFVFMTLIGTFLTFTRRILESPHLKLLPIPSSISSSTSGVSPPMSNSSIVFGVLILIAGGLLLGFSQPSFGYISDRFGRSRISTIGQLSLVGMLLTLIALIGFGLNRFVAIPLIVIFGAGLLAFTPAALAELADVAPEGGRGSTMGLYSISIGAGTAFGPLAGGALIARFGFPNGLVILFALGVVIVLVFLIPRVLGAQAARAKRSAISAVTKE
jgi:MFS family permease